MKLQVKILCLLVFAGLSTGGPVDWRFVQSGYWNEASNWVGVRVPGEEDIAILGFSDPYSVYLQSEQEVQGLRILNTAAELQIVSGARLVIDGDLEVDGSLSINPKGAFQDRSLSMKGSGAKLSGEGVIRIHHSGEGNRVFGTYYSNTHLEFDDGLRVEGSGLISSFIVGDALFVANDREYPLHFLGERVEASGLLMETGSRAILEDTELQLQTGAPVRVVGPGAVLQMRGALIRDGILELGLGGRLEVDDGMSGTFDSFQVHGDMEVEIGGTLGFRDCDIEDLHLQLQSVDGESGGVGFGGSTILRGHGSVLFASRAQDGFAFASGEDVVYEGEYVIDGYGRVQTPFYNSIGISNSHHGELLDFYYIDGQRSIVNKSEIVAQDGGRVLISAVTGQEQGGSIVSRGGDSSVTLDAPIYGGFIVSEEGGEIFATERASFSDLTIRGDVVADEGTAIQLNNYFSLEGEFVGSLESSLDRSFDRPGALRLNGGESKFGVEQNPRELTLGSSFEMSGWGIFGGSIVNHSLISANKYESVLRLQWGDLENYGVVQSVGGSELQIAQSVLQGEDGVVRASGPGSRVVFSGDEFVVPMSFEGGELVTTTGGVLEFSGDVYLSQTRFHGAAYVQTGVALGLLDGFVNDGVIDLVHDQVSDDPTSVWFRASGPFEGDGVIRMSDATGRTQIRSLVQVEPVQIASGIRLEGYGPVRAQLDFAGTLSPGIGLGFMSFQDRLVLQETALCEFEIGSLINDLIVCVEGIELAGTVELSFVDDFVSDGYWSRVVMEGENLSGQFSRVISPGVQDGYVVRVFNDGQKLRVGQTCLADINLDGDVDFFDVSEFVRLYQEGWLGVDLNGDDVLNFFDVAAFLAGYQAGCP